MDGPETPEAKAEGKGESAEAAAEIEAGGRRKEIADDAIRELSGSRKAEAKQMIVDINEWSWLKSRGHFLR